MWSLAVIAIHLNSCSFVPASLISQLIITVESSENLSPSWQLKSFCPFSSNVFNQHGVLYIKQLLAECFLFLQKFCETIPGHAQFCKIHRYHLFLI